MQETSNIRNYLKKERTEKKRMIDNRRLKKFNWDTWQNLKVKKNKSK
jgi:hypothetical protein